MCSNHTVILRFRADPSPTSPATGMRRVTVRASNANKAIKQAVAGYTGPWFVRGTVVGNKKR